MLYWFSFSGNCMNFKVQKAFQKKADVHSCSHTTCAALPPDLNYPHHRPDPGGKIQVKNCVAFY